MSNQTQKTYLSRPTGELEEILESTHARDAERFLKNEEESLLPDDRPFAEYMRGKIREKKLKQQEVFLEADIPEPYGYKLISQEKHTRQRDVILRLCYGAKFTLAETQKALRIYGMPELYAKNPRDALIMIAFNDRPGDIIEVNAMLKKNRMETLRTSGAR